jgi:hypothetical protein
MRSSKRLQPTLGNPRPAERLKAFVVWPLILFSNAAVMWWLEARWPLLGGVAFGALVWTMFFGVYRPRMPNKRMEFARVARPTRKSLGLLLAAHSRR